MGSEMCIRDRATGAVLPFLSFPQHGRHPALSRQNGPPSIKMEYPFLRLPPPPYHPKFRPLYTYGRSNRPSPEANCIIQRMLDGSVVSFIEPIPRTFVPRIGCDTALLPSGFPNSTLFAIACALQLLVKRKRYPFLRRPIYLLSISTTLLTCYLVF